MGDTRTSDGFSTRFDFIYSMFLMNYKHIGKINVGTKTLEDLYTSNYLFKITTNFNHESVNNKVGKARL
mgnify:FL=1